MKYWPVLLVSVLLVLAGGGYAAYKAGGGAGWGGMGDMWLFDRPAHRLDIALPERQGALILPPISGSDDPSLPLVVIDPGHGGRDPGAVNEEHHLVEKDVTLSLARAVRDKIIAQGRVRVALTRDDDIYLTLAERYELARKMGASLFLSIHADASDNEDAYGATIYTLSETASDREAARLAARENGGGAAEGKDVDGVLSLPPVPITNAREGTKADMGQAIARGAGATDIRPMLIDLSQRDALRASADFADILYREAGPYIPFRGRWHRYASLVVLKAPDMPSLLFEAGYISSAQDAARLADEEGRDKIAQGVSRAIMVYFARLSDGR